MQHYLALVTMRQPHANDYDDTETIARMHPYEAESIPPVFTLIRNHYKHTNILAVTITNLEPNSWE